MNLEGFVDITELPLHDAIPRVLPDGWKQLQRFGDGCAYQYRSGLRVIVTTAPFEDGREWMHISVSRRDRTPSYEDLKFVKMTFAEKRWGYQVFPPPDDNISIHATCLHIWVPLTGSLPLPGLRRTGDDMNAPWACFVCASSDLNCGHREPELVAWIEELTRLGVTPKKGKKA